MRFARRLDLICLEGYNIDVTDEPAVRRMVAAIISKYGRLDMLVNAVGGYAAGRALWDMDAGVLSQMLSLNLTSGYILCRAVVPTMLRQLSSGLNFETDTRARHGVLPRRRVAEQYERSRLIKKPRCGAKARRGTACLASAIWSTRSQPYTRCKNHGGLSTGPKTAEGIERIRQAVTKHGYYSKRAKAERVEYRELLRACRKVLASLSCDETVT